MIYAHASAVDTDLPTALYKNKLAEGALAASSAAVDGAAANVLGPQTFDFWTPTAMPAQIKVTLAVAAVVDTVAIIGHNLFSKGATFVHVQYHNGTTFVTAYSVVPTSDADILILLQPLSASLEWRLHIDGPNAPSIAVLMFGQKLVFPEGVKSGYVPMYLALKVNNRPNKTLGGQFIGNYVESLGAMTSIPLVDVARSWVEAEGRDFIDHFNRGRPFVWAACPVLLTEDNAYCWRAGETFTVSYGPAAYRGSVTLEVAGYVG